MILDEEYGYMVGIVNGKMKKVPLSEVAGKLKTVSPKDQIIEEAKLMGISFGDCFDIDTKQKGCLTEER